MRNRRNKTEKNNVVENIEDVNAIKEENQNIEQTEVVTDEELLAKKKNEDNYIFNEEADVLLGKDDKKPSKVNEYKVEKTIVEDKHLEAQPKVEPISEDIVPYEENIISVDDEISKEKEEQATSDNKKENVRYEIDELQNRYDMLEEKNKNLARILKELSVELKEAREESEKQFEVIGKLASEKQNLDQLNKELLIKNKKLELDVEVKDGELAAFKQIGDGAGDIKNTLLNFKETTETINDELNDKKSKLKDSLIKVKELEDNIVKLKKELNKVNDEKEDLAIVVIQQQKKLEGRDAASVFANSTGENENFKDLDQKLKVEVNDLGEQIRSKDRVIVRQINDINNLNDIISELRNEIIEYQDKVDELLGKQNKYILENNSSKNFIRPLNNSPLLGKVMDNDLDLKLKSFGPVTKEKMVSDEEVSALLENIDNNIKNTSLENKTEKQFRFEIFEGIQSEVVEFVNNVIQKEATAYDYIVAMNDFEYDKENIINSYEAQIKELNKKLYDIQKENNKLKIDLFRNTSIDDDGRSISEYRDDNKRLNKQIEFLNEENNILAKEVTDEAVTHLVKVFESERNSFRETEKLFKNQIASLKAELTKATNDLERYNGEYALAQFENEIKRIDDFITKVENGTIQVKSNILDLYFNEAYEKFAKQSLIYNDEIAKRDELLKQLLDDKSEDLGKMVEKDINGELGDDQESREKIKHNEEMIDAIENILGSKIVKLDLESKSAIDKRVFEAFKEALVNMYQSMINNINEKAKAFADELSGTSANKAMELFNNDVNKMAKYYSQAIDEAYLEQTVNTNEFAKLLNNTKLAMLCNEFATLVKFKEEKSREKSNGINHENGEYNNAINANFGKTLEEINEVKNALNSKINQLREAYEADLNALNDDIETTKQQIEAINQQINNNENVDVASLNIDLDAKNKVLNYLENEKKNEITNNFNKQVQDVKLQFEVLEDTERRSKEDYMERSPNEATFEKETSTLNSGINEAYGIKEINQYLQKINNIEIGYFEILNSNNAKVEERINEINNKMIELNKKLVNYRNLLLLKFSLTDTLNVMKTDYSQVREYENSLNEYNYLNKQIDFYNKEIKKAKEKIANGIDAEENKDSLLMFQAKLLNLNTQLEAKNEELEEAKNYYIVSQYVNTIEKLNKIDETIKESGKEIE